MSIALWTKGRPKFDLKIMLTWFNVHVLFFLRDAVWN